MTENGSHVHGILADLIAFRKRFAAAWEAERRAIEVYAKAAASRSADIASLGPIHVTWEFPPHVAQGCRALLCNGAVAHGCYVDAENGLPEGATAPGGNAPLVLCEMYRKPQYAHEPCGACPAKEIGR